MKLYFLNLRTANTLKKNKTARATIPFASARNIGVIFTVEDKQKHELVKAFVHRLEKEGKKVTVMSFLPKGKDNYEFLFDFFSIDDISLWGKIENPAVDKFCKTVFDYLYYIDLQPNPILLNLLARSKASCRIGKHWTEGHPYFELMIEAQPNIRSLTDGFYQYSAQLK